MTADRYAALREAIAAGPTPGPWRRQAKTGANRWRITDASGRQVADANHYNERAEGNAALIAAADPETIAALLKERDAAHELIDFARALNHGLRMGYAADELLRDGGSLRARLDAALTAQERS